MSFQEQYFQKLKFTEDQISNYLKSAERDLNIAKNSKIEEVCFRFSYDALIKLGITIIAKMGYKVRSIPGHHVKTIEQLAIFFKNKDIEIFANKMRQVRNSDMYEGYSLISKKDANEYLDFVTNLFEKFNNSKS